MNFFKNIQTVTILTTALFFAMPALAATLEFRVVGRGNATIATESVEFAPGTNVGQLTVETLRRLNVPFVGDVGGINSIEGLGSDMVTGSTNGVAWLKAYGWCFRAGEIIPDTMPDETPLAADVTTLTWFYAFAKAVGNDWVSMCEPAEAAE